ncbi:WD40/YVTN/BNR-like repeat-containing protein [Marinicella rhabdoformis]|uniref:WD40/YVTN/BNR-like repeat-containing protein n=1 Tax=Marinicella rhabdoformis TaxID=2580566 RepID=UPI0015D006B6|nr:YCF48-related protein [Marinicella rhabdoformis]
MKKINLLLVLFSCSVWAEDTAEIMGLAAESLLLSVTYVGEDMIAVGERGHVLKSDDNGQSWQQIAAVPTRAALTKVASSGKHVWAVGHDATIIHSGDNGATWELQFSDPEREVPFLSAIFLDENTGFVIGAYGTLFSTEDGGKNWNDDLISEELDYHLNDIIITEAGTLVVAAEAGFMFRSEDQGSTWQDVELPYPGSMFGINSLNNEVIAYGLRGHVLRSDDEGVTWEEVNNPNLDSWFGSILINDDVMVLVGANGAKMRYHDGTLSAMGEESSGDDYAAGVKSGNDLILVGEEGIYQQSMYQ